jgi:fused signal recognition particle receptor
VSDSTNTENNTSNSESNASTTESSSLKSNLESEQQSGSKQQSEQRLEQGQEKKRSFFQRFRRDKAAPNTFEENTPTEKAGLEELASPSQEAPAQETLVPETSAKETSTLISGAQISRTTEPLSEGAVNPESEKPKEGMRARFRRALSKTGRSFGNLFLGEREIDDELLEELETLLLLADVGIESTVEIIQDLTEKVKRRELADSRALFLSLQNTMVDKLKDCEQPLVVEQRSPFVLLVVGVNGVGKTTTIGKLAKSYQDQGKSVMLAAGDTFRAAAVEQLQAWGERNNVPVVAQHTGADSASVIYDAIESAKSRNVDILIADTAGRLHTKSNLMEELKKVKRVIGKLDESAPHEVLLVLDAGTGQNAVNQMQEFNDTVNVTGVALTKLDGTAKGGIIFSLCKQFGVPIRFVGLGEGIDDLQPFRAKDYVHALFDQNDNF